MNNQEFRSASFSSVTCYNREKLQSDIVHIGFGAFHRGHQAVFNDLTNDGSKEHWGIFEINMFGASDLVDNLNKQDGLFTVVEKSATETHSRQVRTVTGALHTPDSGIKSAIEKLIEPQVKIVSLTITEKGYCVDPQSRKLDKSSPLIKHDIANPEEPGSAIGLITEALKLRMEAGLSPFSVLSCDNIPENGHLTRDAVIAFAEMRDHILAAWIAENVTFPSTMVDRIVPAMTEEQFIVIEQETGYRDPCGVVCEDFLQWVIEDNFVAGRPQWDLAGAMFVEDVLPYEEMKLRMLNGSHSFLAYNGSLAGHEYIYQCMQDTELKKATLNLMKNEQARSLSPSLNVDVNAYAETLISRFSNQNIKHKTDQIAMDGSQKLPQRAVDPYLTLKDRGMDTKCLPILIAGWMHYVLKGRSLSDPMNSIYEEISEAEIQGQDKAKALLNLEQIFSASITGNPNYTQQIYDAFSQIEQKGIRNVISALSNS